jgi:hypothetical protein
MAFKIDTVRDSLKVVSKVDDAVDSSAENFDDIYKEYLEDLDESRLKFVEGKTPTRFVLKRNLKYEEHYDIRSRQFKVGDKKKGETSFNVAFTFDEVRIRLVGIENPPDESDCVEYKADGSGGASKELMEKLLSAGIVDDLFAALENDKKHRNKTISKKN